MTGVTIRPAFPDDAAAVARLAALDSRRVPAGPLLIAGVDGKPSAAVAPHGGVALADPFRPTAALVDLLRQRAAQLAGAPPPRRRATTPSWLPRRRPRSAPRAT